MKIVGFYEFYEGGLGIIRVVWYIFCKSLDYMIFKVLSVYVCRGWGVWDKR